MLSERMNDALNEQVKNELFASYTYLAMALAFEEMQLGVFAQRFYQQTAEERGHAEKMMRYVIDAGGKAKLLALPEPRAEYADPEEILQAALEHEKMVTGKINELVDLAEEDGDRATISFLDWYITEQVEEEKSIGDLLALVQKAGPQQLFAVQNMIAAQMAAGK
jgi:ferritin